MASSGGTQISCYTLVYTTVYSLDCSCILVNDHTLKNASKVWTTVTTVDHKHMMQGVNNWLMGWAQRVTVNVVTAGWPLVIHGVPQGLLPFSIFRNDLEA